MRIRTAPRGRRSRLVETYVKLSCRSIFAARLSVHTWAVLSAQWAVHDPAASRARRDGPNEYIAQVVCIGLGVNSKTAQANAAFHSARDDGRSER